MLYSYNISIFFFKETFKKKVEIGSSVAWKGKITESLFSFSVPCWDFQGNKEGAASALNNPSDGYWDCSLLICAYYFCCSVSTSRHSTLNPSRRLTARAHVSVSVWSWMYGGFFLSRKGNSRKTWRKTRFMRSTLILRYPFYTFLYFFSIHFV